MILVRPSSEIISPIDYQEALTRIEKIGRICYQSESKGNPEQFVRSLIARGHESVLEHYSVSVKFVVDRGISHEIVRHRIASFAQESTRYCKYKEGLTFVIPPWVNIKPGVLQKDLFGEYFLEDIWDPEQDVNSTLWIKDCIRSETDYLELISRGVSAQNARSVLSHSVKTELVMTADIREWRHFFNLRALGTTGAPHPQMVEVALPLFREFKSKMPALFFDMEESE